MYYYNTTFHIEKQQLNNWKSWVKQTYIPQMLEIGFQKAKILYVVTDEQDSETFSVQLETTDTQLIKNFQNQHEARFRHLLYRQFAQSVLSFSTELQLVEQY